MKKISIVVPCYNEENSIENIHSIIKSIFKNTLKNYDYEIIFSDNYSRDNTRSIIKKLCNSDKKHVKGAFNIANFGFSRNVFECLGYGEGDATFLVFGDLQDPPELLPDFVKKWEEGYSCVLGQKIGSKESKLLFFLRKIYYNIIGFFSETSQIQQYNGFGLYDKSFIEILKSIDDIEPFLKQVVSEYGENYATIKYEHRKSNRGKSNFNFYSNYDFAMKGITSSTKKLLRLSILISIIVMFFSLIYAIYVFVKKICNWDTYSPGIAGLTVGVFMLGSIILFFMGILGEYVLSINSKTLKRPRVVVGEKINFD